MIVASLFALGCLCGLAWSAAQAQTVAPDLALAPEPPRELATPVTLVLVTSDGSPVSDTIDRISGRLGFSHCYLDVGHLFPDGHRLVVDYQPGAGIHYTSDALYSERPKARIVLAGDLGEQIWGCVRSKLGQPFNAAGVLLGQATLATCSGLIVSCLPPDLRDRLYTSGRPIAPNDLATLFGAKVGDTVTFRRERA